jgi:tetratricopeptide (TPR) repeat protein
MEKDPEKAQERVSELEERVREHPHDLDAREDLGYALTYLARALRDLGDREGAHARFLRAFTVREELARETHSREARRILAGSHTDLAWHIESLDRLREANLEHGRALAILEQLCSEEPADTETTRDLAATLRHLASNARDAERNAEAQDLYRRASACLEQLMNATLETEDRIDLAYDLAWTKRREASLLVKLGRAADAEARLREGVTLLEGLLAGNPGHADGTRWLGKLGDVLQCLGSLLEKADRFAEARPLLARAAGVLEMLKDESEPRKFELGDLVDTLRTLELVLHNLGCGDEARSVRERAKFFERRLRS